MTTATAYLANLKPRVGETQAQYKDRVLQERNEMYYLGVAADQRRETLIHDWSLGVIIALDNMPQVRDHVRHLANVKATRRNRVLNRLADEERDRQARALLHRMTKGNNKGGGSKKG